MSSLARLIETEILITDVPTSESLSTEAISLNWADKFSIQVTATAGDSIAHLEVSNNGEDWTDIDSFSIAEDESDMFEVASPDYRWARITLENDDVDVVSASCLVLVIGDAM